MALILKIARFIETQMNAFLDILSDSATTFELAMEDYLNNRLNNLKPVWLKSGKMNIGQMIFWVSIERFLYERTLIPRKTEVMFLLS